MTVDHSIHWRWAQQDLILDAEKAIYWPAQETLLVTDLHLGKVSHFHQEGFAVPGQIVEDDYARLDRLMDRYVVRHWICLGDLFHSRWNREHLLFIQWRKKHPGVQWMLIEGNHDRHSRKYHDDLKMDIYPALELDPFYLIHDWNEVLVPSHLYPLAGHLHPTVRLHGKGRQQVKLPCFWFQPQGAYLPAFGQLTGGSLVLPQPQDHIFVVTDSRVIKINVS